jgi:hypothetical protein
MLQKIVPMHAPWVIVRPDRRVLGVLQCRVLHCADMCLVILLHRVVERLKHMSAQSNTHIFSVWLRIKLEFTHVDSKPAQVRS